SAPRGVKQNPSFAFFAFRRQCVAERLLSTIPPAGMLTRNRFFHVFSVFSASYCFRRPVYGRPDNTRQKTEKGS
ncbi:hypothetical protein LU226_20230, partial [Pantoea sp. Pb-8]|uniref:hypothetical protein n=1 Tax=Pantoea sp. Pb-8 TaxID=2904118 RepID=UPI001E65074E